MHGDLTASINPATGDPTVSASYDPWGTATTTGALPLGFQGGYTDPTTGLTNAHARWYLAETGSFISRDTATRAGTGGQGQPLPVRQRISAGQPGPRRA